MAILGTTDFGNSKLLATVDHDPAITATDVPRNSLIISTSTNKFYRKLDDGPSTNVRDVNADEAKLDTVETSADVTANHAPQAHKNTHKSGGADALTSTDLIEAIVKRLQESGGPTNLLIGNIADGYYLCRSGTAIVGVAPLDTATKEVFHPANLTDILGNRATEAVATNGAATFDFRVPHDFSSIVSLTLVGIVTPAAAGTGKDIDWYSDYSAVGENYQAHQESNTTQTFDLSGASDEIFEFDISGVFSALAAGDYCGIYIDHNAIGGAINYLGIRLRYN